MNVENRLVNLIGEAGRRLHTARSRNDQVATDLRLWVRDEIDAIDAALADLQTALLDQAESHAETVMPVVAASAIRRLSAASKTGSLSSCMSLP